MVRNILAQIRVLEADSILPHEWLDPVDGSSSISENIGHVRDPFPVVHIAEGAYLLLEHTAQYHQLVAAGLDQLPVQVCPPETVSFGAEPLAIVGFDYADLVRLAARHSDQITLSEEDESVPTGFVSAKFALPGSDTITVFLRHSSRTGCPGSLDYLFRAIVSKGQYLPVMDQGESSEEIVKILPATAYLTPPAFDLDDLTAAALSDRLFPPNVVRPSIAYRAMNIDFPISVLRSDIPIAEKEAFLRELIRFRTRSHKTAYVEGRIFILNR